MHLLNLIASCCAKFADKPAIVDRERTISYAELDAAADDFAAELQSCGVVSGDLVCLIGQRSIDFAIAAIAVWRCGASYVPVSGDSPGERIAWILAHTECRAAVALDGWSPEQNAGSRNITAAGGASLLRLPSRPGGRRPEQCPAAVENLAYVIFTSGTTGKPKGVMIGHDTLAATVEGYCAHFSTSEADRVSAVANIAFDASVIEFWPALSRGATVCIADPDTVRSPDTLMRWFEAKAITFCWLPTPLTELLIADETIQPPACLRMIETAGQRLLRRPRGWRVPLENSYGPTETTVIATSSRVVAAGMGGGDPPDIGRPLPGVEVYLLDTQMRLVPRGEVGELYIGGVGVARGYWRQPQLTGQKFVPDPFATEPGRRMYASGDLCRLNDDGNLEFVGRIDDQVKLRGYRIEPGEIEHALAGIEGILQAACVVAELRGVQRLLAYCVLRPGVGFDQTALREQLARKLPDYMLPDAWIALDTLPQTENGKVDRKQLPLPVVEVNADLPQAHLEHAQRAFLDWYRAVSGLAIRWEQDFVHAGGNSIDAILFLQALSHEHGLRLDYASFVRDSAPASLYVRIGDDASAECAASSTRIMPRGPERATLAPASVSQRAIWFLASLAPEDRAYHAKARLSFSGDLCVHTLRDSLQDIVDRHEIFRTSFFEEDGNVIQRIHPGFQIEVPEIDLRGQLPAEASEEEIGAALDRLLMEDLNRPFALDRLPLVRWALVQLPVRGVALLHIEHHLVHDGWSHNLFVRELLSHYSRRSSVADAACTDALPLQYADFSITQAEWLDSEDAAVSEAYWREQLRGAPALIALPTNGDSRVGGGMTLRRHFDRARWRRIEATCRERGHTPFAFVLSAFSYVLSRASGDDDICIGSAFANRSWEGAGDIIGMMISTVVLRMRMGEGDRVRDLLANGVRVCTDAQTHQAYPFESLVRALNPPRHAGANPLFQVFLGFHDSPLPSLRLPDVDSALLKEAVDSSAAKFDLSLVVIPREGQEGNDDPVHMLWEFKLNRFAPWFIETLMTAFDSVVDAFLDAPERQLSEVPIGVTAQASAPRPLELTAVASSTVVARILDIAARQPEAVAVIFGNQAQRYSELAASLRAKAALLRIEGVGPGDRVAVCLERGPELVAWLLAVQCVGAAYVPLDPAYPAERQQYILEHSQSRKLIADDSRSGLADAGLLLRSSTDMDSAILSSDPPAVGHGSPAYVIYTSGSTGRPKGVVVGHDNLSSFMATMEAMFPIGPGARWLAITSCAFDISILELFLPLVRGATMVLASEDDARDAGRLATLLAHSGATHMQATPSTWRALVDTDWHVPAGFVGLCGGEALDAALARQCLARGIRLYNLYGPTETTIWSCAHEVAAADGPVPIGLPLANTEAFVLDRRRRQVPRGAIGELWLGGGGVSHGYLHAPELTAERFIEHPFGGYGRLYATGDLVSADTEGRLYFHGRNDYQVKVSGFRIELGEIEATIRDFVGVTDTVVTTYGKADETTLVAYYVASDETHEGSLIRHCAQRLPGYMAPTSWIRLPALPRTPNGKIDRKALPAPSRSAVVESRAPASPVERAVAAIYADLLGVSTQGVREGFLALGGYSLLAMRAVARINREFQIGLSVVDFLRLATIEAVAVEIETRRTLRSAEFVEEITL
jgi:amino acid adenylation domain-containing protein